MTAVETWTPILTASIVKMNDAYILRISTLDGDDDEFTAWKRLGDAKVKVWTEARALNPDRQTERTANGVWTLTAYRRETNDPPTWHTTGDTFTAPDPNADR